MTKPRKSMEPWLLDDVVFYDHQVEGVRTAMRRRNVLFADEMGLGKSLQSITTAVGDIFLNRAEKLLVVAPVSLKGNWADEFDKFTRIPTTVLGEIPNPKNSDKIKTATPKERIAQLNHFAELGGPRVLIVGYEQVVKHVKELNQIGFDIVFFDEAHYLKGHKSQRTKACHMLRATRYFCLTGTPMLNRPDELWGIMHLMDRNAFPKYYSFRNRYCVFGGFDNKQIIGAKNEQELNRKLNIFQIRRMKKDVLNLPPVQIIQRKVHLTSRQRELYELVEDELRITAPNGVTEDIEYAMTKVLRMRQICGTTMPFTGTDESGKLDLAIDDAIELLDNGHKIVVFTQFRDVLEAYCQRLDKAAPQYNIWELHGDIKPQNRQGEVKAWASDSRPGVMACMFQVAGVGLNMTAAKHVQRLDKQYVPGLNQQAVDRTHRIGASETQSVQVLDYISINTVESAVEAILRSKEKLIKGIVDNEDELGQGSFQSKLISMLMSKDAA